MGWVIISRCEDKAWMGQGSKYFLPPQNERLIKQAVLSWVSGVSSIQQYLTWAVLLISVTTQVEFRQLKPKTNPTRRSLITLDGPLILSAHHSPHLHSDPMYSLADDHFQQFHQIYAADCSAHSRSLNYRSG